MPNAAARVVDIRVSEHDERALAAHFEREFLQRLGSFDRKMPAGLGRARKSDHPHPRIGEDGRADFGGRSGDHAE
jgi:hypothetical protein